DSKKSVTLQKTLQSIFYNKAVEDSYSIHRVFPSSSFTLPVSKKLTLTGNSNFLYLNDILQLDIIQTNYRKRAICYTADHEPIFRKYLFPQGIVYQLETTDSSRFQELNKHVYEALKVFKDDIFIPVRSDRNAIDQFVCSDGDNTANSLYYNLISFKLQNKNIEGAKTLINEWELQLEATGNMPWYELEGLVYALEKTDQIKRAAPYMERMAEGVMQNYKSPNAISGYLSRQRALDILKRMKDRLEAAAIPNKKIDKYYSELL
ncbi:MAG: hypothetical protein ACKO5C_03800, partial [Ferruginibacter sp.]